MRDHLTALCTINDQPATKRHRWQDGAWHTESYSGGSHFAWAQVEVDSIQSLSARLRAIEGKPEWFIVRGEPMRQAKYLRRVYKGDDPHFEPVDRRWLCIDIDGLKAPPGVDHVEYAIARLPPYFHGVACHFQYSSSAGIKEPNLVHLHLWYWLARPACDFSLREWAKALDLPVDAMLYNPVQPHYTANPIIEGAPDPIEVRSGLREGAPELVLPDSVVTLNSWVKAWHAKRDQERIQNRELSRIARLNPNAPQAQQAYVLSALNSACDQIETAPVGERHRTIFAQAASVAELFHTGHVSPAQARVQLENSAILALAGEGRNIEAVRAVAGGIEHGLKAPRDISHIGAEPKEDAADEGWLKAHHPITCKYFERTDTGCKHYAANGACMLPREFMCVEWLKINPAHSGTNHPPRDHWKGLYK